MRIITLLLLIVSAASLAQNLSLTENTTLGQSCGNGQHQEFVFQDVNLNGFTLTLRNTSLKVLNNLNGGGQIIACGNNSNSSVCVNGVIQNNPNLNGLTCQTLSNEKFELTPNNYGLEFEIFNLIGQSVVKGLTNESMYADLKGVYIVKVKGFNCFKIFK